MHMSIFHQYRSLSSFSSIAAAVQNGRPIWVSHRTASAMLLRKLCWVLLILPFCDDTTMSITYYLDYEPFATSLDFPLPTTWSDPRLRYSPILCAPVTPTTISIHPCTYWPDPRLHHHHHRHHHHHDHLRCQPTQPTPKNHLKLFQWQWQQFLATWIFLIFNLLKILYAF